MDFITDFYPRIGRLYPRPDRVRKDWCSLNGQWDFAFDYQNTGRKGKWYRTFPGTHKIEVPFCYQSKLSGIHCLEHCDVVWYSRTFLLPESMQMKRLLHFGAADYLTQVWLDGQYLGEHEGGYTPFTFDITELTTPGQTYTLTVRCEDRLDFDQPRGKQSFRPEPFHCWYTPVTGIWQSVWLEGVGDYYLTDMRLTPCLEHSSIRVETTLNELPLNATIRLTATYHADIVAQQEITVRTDRYVQTEMCLRHNETLEGFYMWQPGEKDRLYDLTFEVMVDGQLQDRVETYFGMRKIDIVNGKVLLNNQVLYQKLILDQGYWPDSLLTAPSDEALRRDVELTLEMGYNGVRKHQKFEDPRYLYWADKLGLLVWGELPSAYWLRDSQKRNMIRDLSEAIRRDYNHPSLITWVTINESWGAPFIQTHKEAQQFADCWASPAHTKGEVEADKRNIDLFAAETGAAMAEIAYLLSERLDKRIIERVEKEIQLRLLNNYQNNSFWWEKAQNNWSAVCAGHIGIALMYTAPGAFKMLLPRILESMEYFLKGFTADGTCLEGFTYWHYGFGSFVWFADMLRQFTDGEMDLLESGRVEQIAGYAQRSFLLGSLPISFSDGTRSGRASAVLQSYLARRFPNTVHDLPENVTGYIKYNVWFTSFFRNFYYLDLQQHAQLLLQDYVLKDAQQVILNREHYALAAKAGHNGEPHNHNDVGSFIFAVKGQQILCDLGCGAYTKQYFHPSTRYSIFCNSSQSHNVPIINGQFQQPGAEFCGIISYADDEIRMEFAGAYGLPTLKKLERTLKTDSYSVTLTDSFEGNLQSITERFVSLIQPKLNNNRIDIDHTVLTWDPSNADLEISEEQHFCHGFDGRTEPVWCIDFRLHPGISTFTCTIIPSISDATSVRVTPHQ